MCAMVDRDVSHVHKFQSTENTKTVFCLKKFDVKWQEEID